MVSQPVNRTLLWFVPVIADGRILVGQPARVGPRGVSIHARHC